MRLLFQTTGTKKRATQGVLIWCAQLRLRTEWGKRQKKSLTREELDSEKKSGIELLSHSQICSTIVAGPLIDRVRDGNVSYKPAMDTGKKGLKMSGLCRLSLSERQANSKLGNCDFVRKRSL